MQDIRAKPGVAIKRCVAWACQRIAVLDVARPAAPLSKIVELVSDDLLEIMVFVGGVVLHRRMYDLLNGICMYDDSMPIGTDKMTLSFKPNDGMYLSQRYEREVNKDELRTHINNIRLRQELRGMENRITTIADKLKLDDLLHPTEPKTFARFDDWKYVSGKLRTRMVERRHAIDNITKDVCCNMAALAALEYSAKAKEIADRIRRTAEYLRDAQNRARVAKLQESVRKILRAHILDRIDAVKSRSPSVSDQMRIAAIAAHRSDIFTSRSIVPTAAPAAGDSGAGAGAGADADADVRLMLFASDLYLMDAIAPRRLSSADERRDRGAKEQQVARVVLAEERALQAFAMAEARDLQQRMADEVRSLRDASTSSSRTARQAAAAEARALQEAAADRMRSGPFISLAAVGSCIAGVLSADSIAKKQLTQMVYRSQKLRTREETKEVSLEDVRRLSQSTAHTDDMTTLTLTFASFVKSRILQGKDIETTFNERIFAVLQECARIENRNIRQMVHIVPGFHSS